MKNMLSPKIYVVNPGRHRGTTWKPVWLVMKQFDQKRDRRHSE